MDRINYDDQTAAVLREEIREVPREGFDGWRTAVRRYLNPSPGMTLIDVGAGIGRFATAFNDWFGADVIAVEPSASMRALIQVRPGIQVLDGHAGVLPLPDDSADGVWISMVIHHIPDLHAAAAEIRRVLRPGAPVLVRQQFPGRCERIELVRWFPETARTVETFPSVEQVCAAFAAAGFGREALEQVEQPNPWSVDEFLARIDTFRQVDTTLRNLTEDEFRGGRERLRHAAAASREAAVPALRSTWLDLLVLR